MKAFTLYQCEFCCKQYNNKTTCEACEKNHKKPVSVEAFMYKGKSDDATGYPSKVKVVFDNGRHAIYERLRSTYE